MPLPALATLDDLDARLPGGLKDRDRARAWACIIDASALVRTVANNKTWANDAGDALVDVPDLLVAVVCAAARRALENPEGVKELQLGAYREVLSDSSGDVYLTAAEQKQVRKAAGLGGVFALATTRGPLETAEVDCGGGPTEWLDVEPPGEPIPWSGPI